MPDYGFPPGVDVASLGPRVLSLRLDQGMTQEQLAGGEFTRAYVSAIEVGKRRVSERAARHFAHRLHIPVEDFYFGYPTGERGGLSSALSTARGQLSAGLIDAAGTGYLAVVKTAQEHADVVLTARGMCGLGKVARHTGDPASALQWFDQAIQLLQTSPSREQLEAIVGKTGALFASGKINAALSLAQDELRREAELPDPDPTVLFALTAATVLPYTERGDLAEAATAADAALALASQVTDTEVLALGYYHLNRILAIQGRHSEAAEVLAIATSLNEHLRLPTEVGMCRFARGFLYTQQGLLTEAETELRAARDILAPTRAIPRQVNTAAELTDVLRRLGKLDEAKRLLAECRKLATGYHDPEQAAELDRIGARIATEQGNNKAAEKLLRSALTQYTAIGSRTEMAVTCRLLAELLLASDRTGDAITVLLQGLIDIERSV